MLLGEGTQQPRFMVKVASADEALHELLSARGLFVRTPLLLPLGAPMHLLVDAGLTAPVDVHVYVAGRTPRPHHAGLYVRPLSDDHGVEFLAAWTGAEPSTHPIEVVAHFDDRESAQREFEALRFAGEGIFPIDAHLSRGQPLELVVTHPEGTVGTITGVVHHAILVDGTRALVVRHVEASAHHEDQKR